MSSSSPAESARSAAPAESQRDKKNFSIAVIAGDGIGPEVIPATLVVLNRLGEKFDVQFQFTAYDWALNTIFSTVR